MANPTINDLRSANPYRNQTRQASGWDKFLNFLGFRSSTDAWNENMKVQADEYDASMLEKQYNENYDSASSQAARMRAAGLNPELDPSSVSAGDSSAMPEDPSTPMQSVGDDQQILGFADKVMSAFTTCIGLTSGVQGLIGKNLQNRLLKYQVDEGDTKLGLSLANELFPLTLPPTPEDSILDDGSAESWLVGATNRASLLTKHMNSKLRKRVMSNLQSYWNSAPKSAEAWEEWSKNVSNEKSYYSESSQFYSADSRVMRSIYEHLGKAREEVEKLKIQSEGQGSAADIAENENREDIAKGLDVGTAVRAENATNEAKYDDAKIRSILRGTIKDILQDLDKNDSPFANVFKTLLSVLSFQYL